MNPVELYEQLPAQEQQWLDEVNFLAMELREHLLPEQFMLALEALTQRLQHLHPQIPCPSGCHSCCQSYALPEVTAPEWQWLQQALSQLSAETQAHLKTQIQQVAAEALDHTGHLKGQRQQHASTACPLLLEGRCSVYWARPFDCRITGYAFSSAGERPLPGVPASQPLPYSCRPEQERMLQELHKQERPLHYMFLPQREKLWQTLQKTAPGAQTADQRPRLLLSLLQQWATAGV